MKAPFAEHLRPYVDAVDRLGATFEATLWASKDHQRVRFEVLAEMCPLAGMVVLDAGCARADLASFLNERGIRAATYIGIEGVPELAEAARGIAPAGSVIAEADFVADPGSLSRVAKEACQTDGRVDVAVFSGSLNTLPGEDALRVLDGVWPLCRKALAFNFLSDRCAPTFKGRDTGPAHRFDTLAALKWALSKTTQVRFRQDYFAGGHDATIVMTREPV
jgi:hypothetical protein